MSFITQSKGGPCQVDFDDVYLSIARCLHMHDEDNNNGFFKKNRFDISGGRTLTFSPLLFKMS